MRDTLVAMEMFCIQCQYFSCDICCTAAPQLTMELHPNKPQHTLEICLSQNALNTPNLLDIIVQPGLP